MENVWYSLIYQNYRENKYKYDDYYNKNRLRILQYHKDYYQKNKEIKKEIDNSNKHIPIIKEFGKFIIKF